MLGRGPWTTGEPHGCPVPGCPETVHRLLCRRHWASLPKTVRDEVWRAWQSGSGSDSPQFAAAARSALVLARLGDVSDRMAPGHPPDGTRQASAKNAP
jgi:hypothetical protein